MAYKPRTAAMLTGLVAGLALLSTAASAGTIRNSHDLSPTGKGWGEQRTNSSSTTITGNGINYHGGPLLLGNPVPIYFIWYGNWTNGPSLSDSQKTVDLLNALFSNSGLNGSPYEQIDKTYYQGTTSSQVSGNLALKAQTSVGYTLGNRLSDSNVQSIVGNAINSGALGAPDPTGLYFVLTSSDVAERSGFCSRYCGWHTHGSMGFTGYGTFDIKYSFVGNPDRCPSACEWQTTSPNGDSGADGMASVMAHESEETISDPDLNAWYDSSGEENADKCAWKFGPTQTAANGSVYNQSTTNTTSATLPSTLNWLIQMNWENLNANGQSGGCAQVFGGAFYTN